jgi:transketolase
MLEKSGSMRTAYGEALVALGETNPNVVVLGADTTDSLKTIMFGASHPDRFFNVGIAEQNLIGVAAGLALGGKIAYAGTYAIFVPGKCVDQIRNVVAYANLNVKIVCSHGGISVGPDGASHQQLEDIAIVRAIPKMKVEVPADSVSAKEIIRAIAEIPGPFYVRITRGMQGANSPIIYENGFEYRPGHATLLRDGSDVAIFACGMMVAQAIRAAEMLAKQGGINATVVDVHSIKPIDQELIVRCAKACGSVVTAEEHNIFGGLGSAIAEVLSEAYPVPVKRIGVKDTFGESGEAPELFAKYGLTPEAIAEAAASARAMKR